MRLTRKEIQLRSLDKETILQFSKCFVKSDKLYENGIASVDGVLDKKMVGFKEINKLDI